jgi:fatty acid desaturase
MALDAPSPSALVHLRPTNARGALVTAGSLLATAVGAALSTRGSWMLWAGGQILLAAALVQWFVVLHECGHDTLFRSRRLNAAVGSIAGLLSMIPFSTWRRVHGRHHKWTGWQDLDPTTEPLTPRPRSAFERAVINVCWRLWIPIFSIVYRAQNFWNLKRVLPLFARRPDRSAIIRDSTALLVAYAALVATIGPGALTHVLGLALVISLIAEDLILLSQHTHLPQGVSDGNDVRPYPAIEQGPFTRSLRLPAWLSTAVLHFDAHELHHMYPFVPGYHLHRIGFRPANEVTWWRWIAGAKRLRADVLLFDNRSRTGADI